MDRRAFLTRLGLLVPAALVAPKLLAVPAAPTRLVGADFFTDATMAARMKRAVEARMAADPHFIPMFPPDPADWAAYLKELEQPRPYAGYHPNEIGVAGALLRQLRIQPEQVRVDHCYQTDRVLTGDLHGLPANEREYELQFKVLAPISTDPAWLDGREFFPMSDGPRRFEWEWKKPEPMSFSPMSVITLKYQIRHDYKPI